MIHIIYITFIIYIIYYIYYIYIAYIYYIYKHIKTSCMNNIFRHTVFEILSQGL